MSVCLYHLALQKKQKPLVDPDEYGRLRQQLDQVLRDNRLLDERNKALSGRFQSGGMEPSVVVSSQRESGGGVERDREGGRRGRERERGGRKRQGRGEGEGGRERGET